jgi:hypothetical protein
MNLMGQFLLVGRVGRQMLQYVAFDVNPSKISGDVDQTADEKRFVESANTLNH